MIGKTDKEIVFSFFLFLDKGYDLDEVDFTIEKEKSGLLPKVMKTFI